MLPNITHPNSEVHFQDERLGPTKVRVCFKYTFNAKKTVPYGSPPPCGWSWENVDVVLGLFSTEHILREILPRTGAPPDPAVTLPHLTIINVNGIYEGTLLRQLRDAYAAEGLTPPPRTEVQAFPQACNRPDVHFRMPGIPDAAIKAWLSLLATGLFQQHAAAAAGEDAAPRGRAQLVDTDAVGGLGGNS